MGRHHKVSEIKSALEKTRGGVYLASELLELTPQALYARIRKSEELQGVRDFYRGRLLDTAELKLEQKVREGDLSAIKYVLSTIGKDRGYVEKREVETSGHLNLEIEQKSSPELDRAIRRRLDVLASGRKEKVPPRADTLPPGFRSPH